MRTVTVTVTATALVALAWFVAARPVAGSLLAGGLAFAAPKPACPASITAAAARAVAGTSVTSCKPEHEDGVDKFEVKLTRKDRSVVEVDVSTDGKVLAVEEAIALDKLPEAVTKAFAARYPKATPRAAEKQVVTDQGTRYELAFTDGGKRKEATFQADGGFVEEE
jgi:hypothetical protein